MMIRKERVERGKILANISHGGYGGKKWARSRRAREEKGKGATKEKFGNVKKKKKFMCLSAFVGLEVRSKRRQTNRAAFYFILSSHSP
jgi:hypothetical protein